ncbi:hypothetical protein EI94DRAFT_1552926, partial [Lactarius quietus]
DLHQFPPVANSTRELYHPTPPNGNCQLGRALFKQFDIVIKLEEQIRVQDMKWNEILQCSRTGDCTKDDIETICKLVLSNPDCDVPDFSISPWNDAILVMSRNSVRSFWNAVMLTQH